uniref:FolateBiopterin Transporter (FBT) Family putative n=1 Tax=Albugo laibachii Nc14 TaxID=890382 RepID=F0WWK8_9STRA|nr:FolateBiopterin Transporter (FBT) Family putative [Albugo laibachii Nc14]|eukprot:CCA25832.1 FolateBiopterin Transporter (FBT) Family putative [Albugo laibachii Nc14]
MMVASFPFLSSGSLSESHSTQSQRSRPHKGSVDALESKYSLTLSDQRNFNVCTNEALGIIIQYAAVGLIYGMIPGTIYPFLQNYYNMEGPEIVAARSLCLLPWSFRIVYSILTDCVPIGGYRRRPYLLLGWSLCIAMLLLMAFIEVEPPYYTDPSVRFVLPKRYTQDQKESIHAETRPSASKSIMCMMWTAFGYVLVDVTADIMLVEFTQREPDSIRGHTHSVAYTVRCIAMIVANCITGICFNGKEYGGTFDFFLTFPELMFCFAIFLLPIFPMAWFLVYENRFEARPIRPYLQDIWIALQTRFVYQSLAFKFLSGVCSNFTSVALDPMQMYWLKVTPFMEKIANVVSLGSVAVTFFSVAKYGLQWSLRKTIIGSVFISIVLDSLRTLSATWNYIRNPWLWLFIPILEQVPQAISFILTTYAALEIGGVGREAAIYGLLTTVSSLAEPVGQTISKLVNAPFCITNKVIQEDSDEIRMQITITLVIKYATQLVALAWLPLLPLKKQKTTRLAAGRTDQVIGLCTIGYLLMALLGSIASNLVSIFTTG